MSLESLACHHMVVQGNIKVKGIQPPCKKKSLYDRDSQQSFDMSQMLWLYYPALKFLLQKE